MAAQEEAEGRHFEEVSFAGVDGPEFFFHRVVVVPGISGMFFLGWNLMKFGNVSGLKSW